MNIKLHDAGGCLQISIVFYGKIRDESDNDLRCSHFTGQTCFLCILQLQVEQPATQSFAKVQLHGVVFFQGFWWSAKKGDPLISPQLFKVAPLARYQEFSWSLFFDP